LSREVPGAYIKVVLEICLHKGKHTGTHQVYGASVPGSQNMANTRTKEMEKRIGRFYKILGIDTFFGDLDVGKGLVSARLAAEQA
jgi:hypothetical protein